MAMVAIPDFTSMCVVAVSGDLPVPQPRNASYSYQRQEDEFHFPSWLVPVRQDVRATDDTEITWSSTMYLSTVLRVRGGGRQGSRGPACDGGQSEEGDPQCVEGDPGGQADSTFNNNTRNENQYHPFTEKWSIKYEQKDKRMKKRKKIKSNCTTQQFQPSSMFVFMCSCTVCPVGRQPFWLHIFLQKQ